MALFYSKACLRNVDFDAVRQGTRSGIVLPLATLLNYNPVLMDTAFVPKRNHLKMASHCLCGLADYEQSLKIECSTNGKHGP